MKELSFIFRGNNFLIKTLKPEDVKYEYVKILKKQKFILYKTHTIKKQKIYIRDINKNKKQTILGIFNKNKLIGTSGIQNLDKKVVDIGIFLFGKKYIKKGFGHFFINLSVSFIFNKYKKKKFKCGIEKNNYSSLKSFQKAGFKYKELSKDKNSKFFFLTL